MDWGTRVRKLYFEVEFHSISVWCMETSLGNFRWNLQHQWIALSNLSLKFPREYTFAVPNTTLSCCGYIPFSVTSNPIESILFLVFKNHPMYIRPYSSNPLTTTGTFRTLFSYLSKGKFDKSISVSANFLWNSIPLPIHYAKDFLTFKPQFPATTYPFNHKNLPFLYFLFTFQFLSRLLFLQKLGLCICYLQSLLLF